MITSETSPLTGLSRLYYYHVLDCLNDLANYVADDFIANPQIYSDLNTETAGFLGELWVRYGKDPAFLAPGEREAIFSGLFDGGYRSTAADCENFPMLRDNLLNACSLYDANIRRGDNSQILATEVTTALTRMRDYLKGVQGSSASWSLGALTEINENVTYRILRDPKISDIFGVGCLVANDWPYSSDTNGNILVEGISKGRIERRHFGLLQELALAGARVMDKIVHDSAIVPDLIENCLSWNSALENLRNSGCVVKCCCKSVSLVAYEEQQLQA